MINYDLPKEIEIDGKLYPITKNGDYRVVLDIITALNDVDLSDDEKVKISLLIFYGEMTHNPQEAINKLMLFISCGEEVNKKEDKPPIMDWEQDFPLLVAPINKVLNTEVRALPYLHWWTFISAYMEIGECAFANVVSIRMKKQKGQKLDKGEQEFFQNNVDKIILKNKMSQEDIDFLEQE